MKKSVLESKINDLIVLIQDSFLDVKLENGVSWREAGIISEYGSDEESAIERNKDEKNDWQKIPFILIGNFKYQDALLFLDTLGLKFYLPICMIYTLKNYKTSRSMLSNSLISKLTNKKDALKLQSILNNNQKICVIRFISLCLEIGEGYFNLTKVERRVKEYWIENSETII